MTAPGTPDRPAAAAGARATTAAAVGSPAGTAAEVVLDFGRAARVGIEEAVLASGKSIAQLTHILDTAAAAGRHLLLTRLSAEQLAALPGRLQQRIDHCEASRTAYFGAPLPLAAGPARVAIVCAGSSDMPIAREAERTLRWHGQASSLFADVGVAGLWRLTSRIDAIRAHPVLIVAAGMDAALPSVLGGLAGGVIFGVPTSVGYGVAAGGRSALESMLSSCAPGIAVLNIDNGYGAACAALRTLNAFADHHSATAEALGAGPAAPCGSKP